MRRFVLALTISTSLFGVALAQEKHIVSPKELVANPDKYVDSFIKIKGIQCVYVGASSGFMCVYLLPGRMIRIDAGAMGAETPLKDAGQVQEQCTGTANMKRAACKFDIEITPASAENLAAGGPADREPMLMIYSNEIELYREGRKRRSY